MHIKELRLKDIEGIKELLIKSGLPAKDIEQAPVLFWGIQKSNELIAIAALELYPPYAIVRSVAVNRHHQDQGLGNRLVNFLEEKAKALNIKKLFLLTMTADQFFIKKGYTFIDRPNCPKPILQSAEYRNLCPGSAISLSKEL